MATFSINVDVNSKSVNDLEQDLQKLEAEFKTLKIGDPGFTELGNKIKGVRSQLKDVELQFEGLDKEQRATALVDTFNGLTGAVGAVSSAFIAFGADSKAIEDAEKKLLGVLGVVNGLRDVSNSFVAANKLLGASFKSAFTTATGAINVTRVALAGLGIGAVIFAVTELADAFDLFGTKAAEANERAARSLSNFETATKNAISVIKDKGDIAVAQAELDGKSEKELLAIKKQSINDQLSALDALAGKQTKDFLRRQKEANGDKEELRKINDEFSKQAQSNAAIQSALNKELALLDINFKKDQKDRNKKAKEDKDALLKEETQAEKDAAKEREAARVSALDQVIAAETSAADAARQRRLVEAATEDEAIQIEYENKLAALQEAQIQEQIAYAGNAEALAAIDKKYADLQIVATAELNDAETELQAKRVAEQKALDDQAVANAQKAAEDIKKVEEAKRAAQKATLDATSQILGTAAGLAEEGSAAAKAFGLAQIGVDTAIALTNAQASAFSPASPDNAVTGGLAGVAKYATYAAIILSNVAKARAILKNPTSTPSPASGGGGGLGTETATIPAPITTQGTFTPLLPQGTTTIGGGKRGERVIKTYVLAGDVTDAQEAEARINQRRQF